MKNILITFTNAIDPTTGGVERVYHNLVPYFREHGYNVFATYQRKTDYDKNSVYTKAIFMEYSIDNVGYFDKLDKVMMEMAVDIVICPFPSYQLFNYCSRLIDKKVFFHVHNVPSKLMYPSSAKLPNILKESFVDRCLKRIRFDLRYLASFRRIELNKMKIVLLSDFFRDDLKSFYDFNPKCICALPNPFCIDEEYQLDYQKKEIELYMALAGRYRKQLKLLLFHAQGSSLGNFREDYTNEMTRVIDIFFKDLKTKYPHLNIQVSNFFVHLNTAWLFTLLEELVMHHIKKDDMKIFISEYIAFETAGWKELMHA
jgi:glycosyltransferase involved in cell wall biosynthesis